MATHTNPTEITKGATVRSFYHGCGRHVRGRNTDQTDRGTVNSIAEGKARVFFSTCGKIEDHAIENLSVIDR